MLIHASAEENIIEKNDKYSNINQDNFFITHIISHGICRVGEIK